MIMLLLLYHKFLPPFAFLRSFPGLFTDETSFSRFNESPSSSWSKNYFSNLFVYKRALGKGS